MDEDWDWDQTLATGITNSNGFFDITFWYSDAEAPDIYLELATVNAKIDVVYSNVFQPTFEFLSGVHDDFGGNTIDWGTFSPSSHRGRVAVHAMTTLTRGWRWYDDRGYGGIDDVDLLYPSGNAASYNRTTEEICLSSAKRWMEDALLHEYGHHWADHFSDFEETDYCNPGGRCDSGGDCKHCEWCQESAVDAWREGLPNWLANSQIRSLAAQYDPDPVSLGGNGNQSDLEDIEVCIGSGGDGTVDDPWQTESIFGALLRDIEDSSQDDDDAFFTGVADELSMGTDEILDVARNWVPVTPSGFINGFIAFNPTILEPLWATAKNNGFTGLDVNGPGTVTGFTSPSHSTSGDSPDGTIDFVWDHASDDVSGIAGYSIAISAVPGFMPPAAQTIGKQANYTTTWLTPGTYYVSIRAVDREGLWSPLFVWSGPYTIREPYPPDLSLDTKPASWAYSLVPQPWDNEVPDVMSIPGALIEGSTYLNMVVYNRGELTTFPGLWLHSIRLDGVQIWGPFTGSFNPVPGLSFDYFMNHGPFTVRGGHHTLSAFLDYTEAQPEEREWDNDHAQQWAWYVTSVLPAGSQTTRAAPPDPVGGLLSVNPFTSYNCDGLTINQGAMNDHFGAAYIRPLDDADDYDLRLHPYVQSTIDAFSFDGVAQTGAYSTREAGRIDAVFVNAHAFPGNLSWHLGMVNANGGTSDYELHYEVSSEMTFASQTTVSLADDEYLSMRHVYLGPGDAGYVTIEVDVDPVAGPIQLLWLNPGFEAGDMLDYEAYAVTDESGHAVIDDIASWIGWYCLVVHRDPIDVPAAKGSLPPVDVMVQVDGTPADLAPDQPASWWAPIVPSTTALGPSDPATLPASLPGNVAGTFVNTALANVGPNDASNAVNRQLLDGVTVGEQLHPVVDGGAGVESRGTIAITVRGGRHTLSMQLDPDLTVPEMDELNNATARQWAWSPLMLTGGPAISRAVPPDPIGGWWDLLIDENNPASFNSDGLRMLALQASEGRFRAVAVMPGPASDVDVRMHPATDDVRAGFSDVVAASGWGIGMSDYVVGNFDVLGQDDWDVGVIAQEGDEGYFVELVTSTFLAASPSGEYGSFTMGAGTMLHLYEVKLEAGLLSIGVGRVGPVIGPPPVDWGFTLHPKGYPFAGKSTSVQDGLSWLDPAGQTEYVTVTVPAAGTYCLAVWKVGSVDLPVSGDYVVRFYPDATDVPDFAPAVARTGIASIHPNPFNPRTTVTFEVETGSDVLLAIYDLKGRLVRELLQGPVAAGRHEAVWDGTDRAGIPVASGVYVAQFIAGVAREHRKLLLLK